MKSRRSVVLRHTIAVTGLLIGTAWLFQVGRGVASKASIPAVAGEMSVNISDPTVLAFALVWLVAVAFAAYLLVVTSVSAVVRVLELPRAARIVERAMPAYLRRLLSSVAALGVIAAPSHLDTPRITPVHTVTSVGEPPDDGQATLHLLGADEQPTAPFPAAAVPEDADARWTVEPGDSLWFIASSHLTDANGRAMTDAEIEPYWHQLIETNRDRLVNPDDPDLIFANQVFELPPVDAG